MSNVEVINEQTKNLPANLNDRILALKAKSAEVVTQWTAEPGTTIAGILHSKRQVQTQYGAQEQFILQDENCNLIAYWLSKFIEGQLRSNGANYGDLICISSHGKAKTSAGKEYNSFSVLVDRLNG